MKLKGGRKPIPIEESSKILGDRLKCVILGKASSYTGKYFLFYGTHYNGRMQCYDVGAYNNVTGEIIRRHYTDKTAALVYWDDFREGMQRPKPGGEADEPKGFTIYDPKGKPVN